MRIFYVLPVPILRAQFPNHFLDIRDFFDSQFHAIRDHAGYDTSGSDPVGGALGIKNANHIIFDQFVDESILVEWQEAWNNRSEQQSARATDSESIQALSEEYRDAIANLSFGADGWSRTYVPCPFNSHTHDGWGSQRNKTGVFRHDDGNGYTLHCFKCEQKKTYRTTPRAVHASPDFDVFNPAVSIPQSDPALSYTRMTHEQREVSWHVLGIDSQYGWESGYLWASRNGQPPEAERRRLYNDLFRGTCDTCQGKTLAWIDKYRLTAGYHCESCHHEIVKGSWLKYQLGRKPNNSDSFEPGGYLADDLADTPLHLPGKITFIATAMGTGKTQAMIRRTYQDIDEGADYVTLLLTPRKTLARSLWLTEERGGHQGDDAWGLFCGGAYWSNIQILKYGAIGTMPQLDKMVKRIPPETPIRIAIDEFDFSAGGKGLINAGILKQLSKRAKEILSECARKDGLVLLGQTATCLDVEAFAAELGLDPHSDIKTYHKPAEISGSTAEIRLYPNIKRKTYHLVAGVVNSIANDLEKGKRVYLFGDGRRKCQAIIELIKERFPQIKCLFLDKYRRGNKQNIDLLRAQRQTETMLFVSTNALDVGISLLDSESAVHVMLGENPLNFGSVFSTVQRCMRNREKPDVLIHLIPINNPLPTTPSWNRETMLKAHDTEQDSTLDLISTAQAVHDFVADQPETVLDHHLRYAGYIPKHSEGETASDDDVQSVKETIKILKQTERIESKALALQSLENHSVFTTREIERRIDQDGFGGDMEAIAAEKANRACQAAGWNDEVIGRGRDRDLGIGVEQWHAAKQFLESELDYEVHCKRRGSFVRLHFPHRSWEQRQDLIDDDQLELNHIPPPPGAKEELLAKLLLTLPKDWSDRDTVEGAILESFQHKYKGGPLSEYADGRMGRTIRKQLRFAKLGPDVLPGQNHKRDLIKWANRFLNDNYFARLSQQRVGKREVFCLVQSDKAETECGIIHVWLRHVYPEIDWDREGLRNDLMPAPLTDPETELKAQAQEMRNRGMGIVEIAEHFTHVEGIPISKNWVARHTTHNLKTNRNTQILQMHKNGKSNTEIAAVLGIHRKTVARVLSPKTT